jgi:hypothetical protein
MKLNSEYENVAGLLCSKKYARPTRRRSPGQRREQQPPVPGCPAATSRPTAMLVPAKPPGHRVRVLRIERMKSANVLWRACYPCCSPAVMTHGCSSSALIVITVRIPQRELLGSRIRVHVGSSSSRVTRLRARVSAWSKSSTRKNNRRPYLVSRRRGSSRRDVRGRPLMEAEQDCSIGVEDLSK